MAPKTPEAMNIFKLFIDALHKIIMSITMTVIKYMPYAVIALSPVVIWGTVFALVCALCPGLFWPFAILQIINLSGAAGDFYVSWLLGRMPEDVLIRDDGVSMAFYARG